MHVLAMRWHRHQDRICPGDTSRRRAHGAQEAPEKHEQERLPGNSLPAGSAIAYLEAHGEDKCKEGGRVIIQTALECIKENDNAGLQNESFHHKTIRINEKKSDF